MKIFLNHPKKKSCKIGFFISDFRKMNHFETMKKTEKHTTYYFISSYVFLLFKYQLFSKIFDVF